MNNFQSNLLSEFMKLGCDRRNAAATVQVYMDMCEVKRMYDVSYSFSKSLQRMFLTAKHSKSSNTSIFVPVIASENISLFEVMNNIHNYHFSDEIYLVLISPDSTCVYYQISRGLEDPLKQPDLKLALKRRGKLDVDISTKTKQIQEAAKSHALGHSSRETS